MNGNGRHFWSPRLALLTNLGVFQQSPLQQSQTPFGPNLNPNTTVCTYWLSQRSERESIWVQVRAPWPRAKYFPVWPDLSQSISNLSYAIFIFKSVGRCLKQPYKYSMNVTVKCGCALNEKITCAWPDGFFQTSSCQDVWPYTPQLANIYVRWHNKKSLEN